MKVLSILQRKFVFKKNPKVDLLILDDNFSKLNFSKNKYHVLRHDEELHLKILLKAVLKKFTTNKIQSFSDLYFKLLIDSFDPKVALGHDMNNKIFRFSKLFPEKISIAYQFAYIFKKDINDFYRKNFTGQKVNYYIVYDKRSKHVMKKFVKSNFIINGSIKINERNPKKKKKKFDIMFISSFRNLEKTRKNEHDGFFVKILDEYCQKNNKKFCIALSSNREDKKNKILNTDEINYFKKYSKSFKVTNLDSITLSEFSELCVCSNSNLGYELLLAKMKILFLGMINEKLKFFENNNGPFWYFGNNKNKIEKKINNLLEFKQKRWLSLLSKKNKKVEKLNFDLKNYHMKKFVDNLCNKY